MPTKREPLSKDERELAECSANSIVSKQTNAPAVFMADAVLRLLDQVEALEENHPDPTTPPRELGSPVTEEWRASVGIPLEEEYEQLHYIDSVKSYIYGLRAYTIDDFSAMVPDDFDRDGGLSDGFAGQIWHAIRCKGDERLYYALCGDSTPYEEMMRSWRSRVQKLMGQPIDE